MNDKFCGEVYNKVECVQALLEARLRALKRGSACFINIICRLIVTSGVARVISSGS